ncbi:MFS transporter [Paraburkholderia sp. FT54]|jgi:putative MFS transporter|uniref:MFS transporter n=1 Tax=Paraburkholderia sp. FT54 TaxID=3074437 RepID=UPI002877E142|nr:MFS transporter [Paraburkholderia sp. FT54]WNC94942.1 MFS transporter [Paraburkholderia sp. FT54]
MNISTRTRFESLADAPPTTVAFENAPLTPFHLRVTFAGTGGQFSDGFVLGIIGIALAIATPQLHLNAVWLGILGAASLAGLFAGSLFAGSFVDRFGRRALFNYDMALFAVISVAQFWVTSPTQLLILRLLLGITLGFDYVVSKALVVEYSPMRLRGRLLSWLAIAWALGYACAYVVGYLLKDHGPDIWRVMLLSSAVPAAVVFLFRVRIPESPLWLQRKGRTAEAMAIIRDNIGPNIVLNRPAGAAQAGSSGSAITKVFSGQWRTRLFIACFFYMCLVIPYFSLGTFSPMVFASLHIQDKFLAGLIYNVFLLLGTVAGALVVDRISRRAFLLGGFFLSAIVLACLSFGSHLPGTAVVALFAVFALVLSGTNNLCFLYPQELFTTELRATALGFAVAASRIGSAVTTFLFPSIVAIYGGQAAVYLCVVVLAVGGVICAIWAPETRHASLES